MIGLDEYCRLAGVSRDRVLDWLYRGVIGSAELDEDGNVVALPDSALGLDCLPGEGELRLAEFIRRANCSKATVMNLLARGGLPGARRSRLAPHHVFVPERDLRLVGPVDGELTLPEFIRRCPASESRIRRLVDDGAVEGVRTLASGRVVVSAAALEDPVVRDLEPAANDGLKREDEMTLLDYCRAKDLTVQEGRDRFAAGLLPGARKSLDNGRIYVPARLAGRKAEAAERNRLTVRRAAEEIGVCTTTIRRWIRKGLIPNHDRGNGTITIPRSDVKRLRRLAHEVRLNGCRTRNAELQATREREAAKH
ncbi:helix-turn-helix domain-containing protein [Bifidobacterium tissieri]|uniref:Helix-turn-helix domain-containing protein n=1 Tax=Bifidobacterium tissieri TaxID=1630162 RepID=A0A5M9ZYL9_9BIFI|nr:helix-turn-helix domain-containing protein [Bifidobacterium tissieri]KAA8831972.1 helix-turn-helix domain-containing protein [Bifidobacterium tissieri]